MKRASPSPTRSQRGSVLLVALLLSIGVAVAVASYFALALASVRTSDRSYHYNVGINFAETGLEEGMWSVNQFVGGNTTAFSPAQGWSIDSGNAKQKLTGDAFGEKSGDYVNVVVKNYAGVGTAPSLAVRAVLTPASGAALEKWIEVRLARRSSFSSGLVARTRLLFAGTTATLDSWDSTPATGPLAIPYSSSVAHDSIRVASSAITSSMTTRAASISGFVSVSGDSADTINLGPAGSIGPFGTAAGVKNPSRISTDFNAPLDPTAQPATNVPPLGFIAATQAFTGTNAPSNPADPSTWTTYNVSAIDATNAQLTVTGYVRLVLSAPEGSSAFRIGDGPGSLTISANAHLAIYTAGNIIIGGQGISDVFPSTTFVPGLANALYLYGTGLTDGKQTITLAGNGRLDAAIYAPYANVAVTGGDSATPNDIFGSLVASSITLNGNVQFHYNEALGVDASSSPYRVDQWRELTSAADRASWANSLSF